MVKSIVAAESYTQVLEWLEAILKEVAVVNGFPWNKG